MKTGRFDKSVDQRNASILRKIIDEYGWPGKSLVGGRGADAAWLLAQHADHDLEFQKRCLKLIRKAIRSREADLRQEAYLTDRIRKQEGRPQIYGTQFFLRDGRLELYPLTNKRNLDDRRKAVNLVPFKNYLSAINKRRGE